MKRTNLILDENLLKEALILMGARTYSEAVNRSLNESVRLRKAKDVLKFQGSGVWEGDLNSMREDTVISRKRKPQKRSK